MCIHIILHKSVPFKDHNSGRWVIPNCKMDAINCTTYTDITGSPICKNEEYKYKMATTTHCVSQKFDKAKIEE